MITIFCVLVVLYFGFQLGKFNKRLTIIENKITAEKKFDADRAEDAIPINNAANAAKMEEDK